MHRQRADALQESLAVATRTEAMKPSELGRVEIDTTVMFPTRQAAQPGTRAAGASGPEARGETG